MFSNLDEVVAEVGNMIRLLKVRHINKSLLRDVSVQFEIDAFGLVICCLDSRNYGTISSKMEGYYDGWRICYIAIQDKMYEKREEVIFELMKGGYMRWIRETYNRSFRDLIISKDFGRQIIKKRLSIWNDRPKFKYLIEENKQALTVSGALVLNNDPSFFDMIPEVN